MLIYLLIKVDFYLIITIVNKIDFNLYEKANYFFKYFFPNVRYYASKHFKDVLSTKQKKETKRDRGSEDRILIRIYDTIFKVALFLFANIPSYILISSLKLYL